MQQMFLMYQRYQRLLSPLSPYLANVYNRYIMTNIHANRIFILNTEMGGFRYYHTPVALGIDSWTFKDIWAAMPDWSVFIHQIWSSEDPFAQANLDGMLLDISSFVGSLTIRITRTDNTSRNIIEAIAAVSDGSGTGVYYGTCDDQGNFKKWYKAQLSEIS